MPNPPQSVELLLNDQQRIEDDLSPLSDERALRRRVTRQLKKRREFRTHLVLYGVICLMFLAFFSAIGVPWIAGIIVFSWGAGLAAQAVDLYFDTNQRAAARLARIHQAFRDAYGPRWQETATREQLIVVRSRADGPIQRRCGLFQHIAVYLCINLMLWLLYLTTSPGGFAWPALVSGLWGLGLAVQAYQMFSQDRSSQSIEREIERQRALMEEAEWASEKPKNDFLEADDVGAMTVGPDGELIELDAEADDQPATRPKRR